MPQRISRRRAVASLGSVSLAAVLAACGDDDPTATTASPSTTEATATTAPDATSRSRLTPADFDAAGACQVTTESTEGPYYFDVDAIRADLREDREGTTLRLGVRVRDLDAGCTPLENAVVDIWHCDATGLYSGFESASKGGPGGGRSDDETYLRGAQATNADGIVEFTTIYPGWYRGRTTHVHAKVHLDKRTLLTTQFFTSTTWDERVFAATLYSEDTGRDTFNEDDGIFQQSGGTGELTLARDGDDVLGLITLDVRRS